MHHNAIEEKKEITIIGFVKEIDNNWKSGRIGISAGNEFFAVKANEEGKNLLYEVGNKVEATGIISRTKDGRLQINVTGYEVFEMDEDDFDEYGDHPDNYFNAGK
jgi:vacuolar-type H+-ATPase subunit E/Vma4